MTECKTRIIPGYFDRLALYIRNINDVLRNRPTGYEIKRPFTSYKRRDGKGPRIVDVYKEVRRSKNLSSRLNQVFPAP
ncbi:MAG: hypothetical protein Q8P10_03635 [bacterium]|nr:hypothetical protein [bacterium]